MANHKRGRPKHQRAGCLYCKPHKDNGSRLKDRDPPNLQRRLQEDVEDVDDTTDGCDGVSCDYHEAIDG
jgi:hypothetical protein